MESWTYIDIHQVRVENVPNPEDNIPTILERVRKEYIQRTYNIMEWTDPNDFLEQLARKTGKLLKKGEPDFHNAAMLVLHDWLRGRIPYYVPPPEDEKPSESKEKKKIGVEQIFKNIAVSSNYLEDDLKKEDLKQKEDDSDDEQEGEHEKEDEAARAEDPADWDEIFESVVGEEGPVTKAPVIEGEEEDEDEDEEEQVDSELEMSDMGEELPSDEEEEEESPRKKKKTPKEETPSKKKKIGVHYYETANVKNRNRNKVRPDETAKKVLNSRLKGSAQAGSKRKRR